MSQMIGNVTDPVPRKNNNGVDDRGRSTSSVHVPLSMHRSHGHDLGVIHGIVFDPMMVTLRIDGIDHPKRLGGGGEGRASVERTS